MAIRKPQSRSYFCDVEKGRVRVVLCIPREEIVRRVAAKEWDGKLARHYPDGLDFEVSGELLRYYEKRYGLALGLDPEALRAAFETYRGESGKDLPGRGLLPAAFLEGLAKDLAHKLPAPKAPDEFRGPAASRIAAQHRVRLDRRRVIANEAGERRGKLKPPKLAMTKGEEPVRLFLRVQQRRAKGGE